MAWLQAQSEQQSQYKCLTQFKKAESVSSSLDDTVEDNQVQDSRQWIQDDDETHHKLSNDPYCLVEQEMKTKIGECDDVVDQDPSSPDNKSQPTKEHPCKQIAITPASSDAPLQAVSQTCQHESENKCIEGETEKSFSSPKQPEKQNLNLYLQDDQSIVSKSSTSSSRKSDVGTNTETGPSLPFATKHQVQRKNVFHQKCQN